MTSKTIDWLNENRFRAYPFRSTDPGIIVDGSRIPDCVVLDCLVVDTRVSAGKTELTCTGINVSADSTLVAFEYDGEIVSFTISGGDTSGINSVAVVRGVLEPEGWDRPVYVTITFSSHAYILDKVGVRQFRFKGGVLDTRVVRVAASGLDGLDTNGSANVQGGGLATGTVHLVDGYRTQPVIKNGKVMVRTGRQYGYDPCDYPYAEDTGSVPCGDLLLFFCGQNAITSGNIVISGGSGVSVSQGRMYTPEVDLIDTYGEIGIAAGEAVPCIEFGATTELLNIYVPNKGGSSSDSSPDSSDSPEEPEG